MCSRKSGPHSRPNRTRYERFCVMCGVSFKAARPEAKCHDATCRSSLRRWLALFGYVPSEPPGVKNWHNTFVGRAAYRALRESKAKRTP